MLMEHKDTNTEKIIIIGLLILISFVLRWNKNVKKSIQTLLTLNKVYPDM